MSPTNGRSIDRATYEASYIDWERLNNYAARVAKETRVPLHSPLSYSESVMRQTAAARPGFFGFGAREAVYEQVEVRCEALGPHWPLDQRDWRLSTVDVNEAKRIERETIGHDTLAHWPTVRSGRCA